MNTTDGKFFLIKHPNFDSFSIIHICGDGPAVFHEQFERLLPGNQNGHHKGVEIKSNHPYLDYLKKDWPEGFKGFEERKEEEISGIRYRLVTKYLMM